MFAAAMFSVHPLHVESVAWISERKDVLSTFFWLLSTAAYFRYVRTASRGQYAAVGLFLTAGLMSKAMLVTLPFTLLLLDFWPLRRQGRGWWRLVTEKFPLFLIVAAFSVLTYWTQDSGGSVADLESLPLANRVVNATIAYGIYLRQTFWPVGLAAFYPLRPRQAGELQMVISAIGLAILTAVVISQRRRRAYLVTGWFWFLGTLVPVIGLVHVGEQAHADRYMYVPMIGLAIMLAWFLDEAAGRSGAWDRAIAYGQVLTVSMWAVLTSWQISYWRNGAELWSRSLLVAGPSAPAYYGLADALRQSGDYEGAVAGFQNAIALSPGMLQARAELGWSLLLKGDIAAADQAFSRLFSLPAMSIDDASAAGTAAAGTGDADLAAAYWARALAMKPDHAETHLALAIEMLLNRHRAPARRHIEKVRELKPSLLEQPQVLAALEAVENLGGPEQ